MEDMVGNKSHRGEASFSSQRPPAALDPYQEGPPVVSQHQAMWHPPTQNTTLGSSTHTDNLQDVPLSTICNPIQRYTSKKLNCMLIKLAIQIFAVLLSCPLWRKISTFRVTDSELGVEVSLSLFDGRAHLVHLIGFVSGCVDQDTRSLDVTGPPFNLRASRPPNRAPGYLFTTSWVHCLTI